MTNAELKAELNALLARLGKPPVRGNLTRAQVEAKLAAAQATLDYADAVAPIVTTVPAPADNDTVTINDLAAEHGIDPKVARARLRKAGKAPTNGRWSFAADDVPAIVAIIHPQ